MAPLTARTSLAGSRVSARPASRMVVSRVQMVSLKGKGGRLEVHSSRSIFLRCRDWLPRLPGPDVHPAPVDFRPIVGYIT